MIHIPNEFLSDSQMIFYKKNRKFVLFTVIDELLTLVVQKCHLFKTKAKSATFWKTNVQSITLIFCSSLSLPPGCVGGERGMGLKFGGKGNQFKLNISSEKLQQIGALYSFSGAETYLPQL